MNRTTAILLALGILLAHSLGIHRDFQWNFAAPYDSAHLAYALGENMAAGHGCTLGEAGPGMQAYPSPLWVGLAWLSSLLDWQIPLVAQMVSLISALLLISASTRIAQDRVAGVIPPLLLVLSGTMASGAVSGTEHATLAMLLVVAFVSFEKNHPRFLMLALALMALTRAEGLVMAGAWFLLWAVDRFKGEPKREYKAWIFVPAAAIGGFFCWYTPEHETHSIYGAFFQRVLNSQATGHGWMQLLDFTKIAISPIWMVPGLLFVIAAKVSGAGIRAYLLASVYLIVVVRKGGEDLPFALAFLPALPLICLVVQEMIVAALDTYRPSMEAASWVILLVTALASATASKFPGDVGPLSLEEPHSKWLQARAPVSLGQNVILGRTQLHTEIRRTSEMRRVGQFLAQYLDGESSVLSPWVGSLTYYTANPIQDWFSRLQTVGETPKRANLGHAAGAPLMKALDRRPALVLPAIGLGATLALDTFPDGLNPALLELGGDSTEAKVALTAKLHGEYGLIALPIPNPTNGRATPYFVYQRLDISTRPTLHISGSTNSIHVDANLGKVNRLHLPQMVYLVVQATDEQGVVWIPEPSGRLVKADAKQASTAPVVLNSGAPGKVRLWSGDLSTSPSGSKIQTIEAQLLHTRVARQHALAPASDRAQWQATPARAGEAK